MAGKKAAGLLVYRKTGREIAVFLVHPGGPVWAKKDLGAWSIPKGEYDDDEEPLAAARREFLEETGQEVAGEFLPLTPVKQKSGKQVTAWMVEGEVDADKIVSNTFPFEYPYKSGKFITIPEVDKGGWFSLAEAKQKINPAQIALLDELDQKLRQ